MMGLGGGRGSWEGVQHVLTLVASTCDNMLSHSGFGLACPMFRDQCLAL